MSIPVLPEGTARLGPREAWGARAAVLGATVLCRFSPERIARVLSLVGRGRPSASWERTARARTAVCTVSLACRGPRGCLVRSVATVLACRLAGVSVTWCTGFALTPFRAHAWVAVEGRPVGEEGEVADYKIVLRS